MKDITEFSVRLLTLQSYTSWIVVLGSIGIAFLVHLMFRCVQQRRKSARSIKGIPGPPGHWLKGHIDYVKSIVGVEVPFDRFIEVYANSAPHDRRCPAKFDGPGLKFHLKCTTEFKTCYHLWYGPLRSAIILCHPDTVQVVQSSSAPKEKWAYNMIKPFIGDGLITSEGDKWFRMRKLLTSAFHFDILRPYVRVFQESTKVLLGKWSSQGRGEVELFHHVSLMTLDSILKCSLSYKSDCQVTQGTRDPYTVAVCEAANQCLDRLVNPLLHADDVYKLTPDGRKFFKNSTFAHAKAEGIVKTRRKALQDNAEREKLRKKKHLDFLDVLLEAKDDNGTGLTDEEIIGEVMTFMFAGHDTTASATSWTLYCLAMYPEHQEKCRKEIDEVFGDQHQLEWAQLGKLKYLLLCIKESCRMFAPVPFTGRSLDKSYEIDGHLVPEGSWVITNVHALHHNPHVWKDPKRFDPMRFTTENTKDMSPYAFIPFSAGPRNCIGQTFAMTEVKTSLAMILRKFKLTIDPKFIVPIEDLVPTLVMRAKNGIRVNIFPR